jgi:translation initiation factor 2 beta subunit (eIF-2beta)/eIF-5
METLEDTPSLRWFDKYPACRMCGKKAEGLLMSDRNESYGAHCQKCADKRLKVSAKVRTQLAARLSQEGE